MLEIKYLSTIDVKQNNCTKVCTVNEVKTFTDGANKYILFTIFNHFYESLASIKLKISQFDENGKCLKREIKTYKDLSIKRKGKYTIKDLVKVDVMLASVEIDILEMSFVTIAYNNGCLTSACVKYDKNAKHKEEKIQKKLKKHPDKIKKKYLKTVEPYSFSKILRGHAGLISLLVAAFMVSIIALIACYYCKTPSPDSMYLATIITTFIKGGLF